MSEVVKVITEDGEKKVVVERTETTVSPLVKSDIEEKIRICDRTVTELEAQIVSQNESKAKYQAILDDNAAAFAEVAAADEAEAVAN